MIGHSVPFLIQLPFKKNSVYKLLLVHGQIFVFCTFTAFFLYIS